MDSVPKDVVILILEYLDAKSVVAVSRCARRYSACYKSDIVWRRHLVEEFGPVEKSDVEPVASTWWITFRAFSRALKVALAAEGPEFNPFCTFQYRKARGGYEGRHGLQALLFRRSDASMVIPVQTPWIKPRRGDTFVDLRKYGYRNQGITFWNGTHRICLETNVDGYGSPPFEFAYPEFPFGYFYCGHGECWNIRLSEENVKAINEKGTLTFEGHEPIDWTDGTPKAGDLAVWSPDCDFICLQEESNLAIYVSDEEDTE